MMQKPIHIFLADDDADDRVLFYEAIRLTIPDAEMTMANNGFELIEALQQSVTTLSRVVFLDLNMPIKNGHECLNEIRSSDSLNTIPIVIYSTSDDPRDIDKSYTGGADFYIRKPNSFNDLLDIVKAFFALNRTVHIPPVKDTFVMKSGPEA